MSDTFALFSILGALLLGAISPGPSFVLVTQLSMRMSRRDGIAAALGMGLGGAIYGTLAVAGLTALLQQVDWLYLVLKLAGGAYLIYLGIGIWRGASAPLDVRVEVGRPARLPALVLALITQLSNPKTAVVYGSIFAALLPASPPLWLLLALPPLIFVVEAGWYLAVALVFSATVPRSAYLAGKRWIDRVTGAVMGALGARLIWDAALSHD